MDVGEAEEASSSSGQKEGETSRPEQQLVKVQPSAVAPAAQAKPKKVPRSSRDQLFAKLYEAVLQMVLRIRSSIINRFRTRNTSG